jgi:hypothetical protein
MTISKGPWKAIKFTHPDFDIWDVDYPRYADERFSVLEDLTEEDAHLIAAAPKMYEALMKIAAIENKSTGGDWDEIEEARNIARAAIKEAENSSY